MKPDPKNDFSHIKAGPFPDKEPLTGREILAIAMEIQNSGVEFGWEQVDDFVLWSAVVRGDSTVAVGFEKYPELRLTDKRTTENYLLEFVKYATGFNDRIEKLRQKEFKAIESVVIKVSDYSTIARLRKIPFVRYVEPWGFSLEAYMADNTGGRLQSASGCTNNGIENSADAFTLYPGFNSAVSWHLTAHKVDAAWNLGAGAGVTIGVIDTGINSSQELLSQEEFDWDPANPRTIEIITNDEDCAHGVTVTGMIAGPVNNGGAITGVAHLANVVSYKAGDGVLLNNQYEKEDLAEGLELFALDPDVRVINISLGYYFANNTIWDALVLARNHDKLVVCAAGSTAYFYNTGWGIYPAKHSNTLAVTGIFYDPARDPNTVNPDAFGGNFSGRYVDFCTFLKRKSDGRLGLGMHDDTNDRVKARGSSAAAALVSGIAALVWEQNPGLSRDEVIDILKNAASIYDMNKTRDSRYGWGAIDAEKAVILARYGFMDVSISGPTTVSTPGTAFWTANVTNAGGTVYYTWYWNGLQVGHTAGYYRHFSTATSGTGYLELVVTTSVGQEERSQKLIYLTDGPGGGGPGPVE